MQSEFERGKKGRVSGLYSEHNTNSKTDEKTKNRKNRKNRFLRIFCRICLVPNPKTCLFYCGCCFNELLRGDSLQVAREGALLITMTLLSVFVSFIFVMCMIMINLYSIMNEQTVIVFSTLLITFSASCLGVFFFYCSSESREKIESFYDLHRFHLTYYAKFCTFLLVSLFMLSIGSCLIIFSSYYSINPMPIQRFDVKTNQTIDSYLNENVFTNCIYVSILYIGVGFYVFVNLLMLCNKLVNPPDNIIQNLIVKTFIEENERWFNCQELKKRLNKLYYYKVGIVKLKRIIKELEDSLFLMNKKIGNVVHYKKKRTKDILCLLFNDKKRTEYSLLDLQELIEKCRTYAINEEYLKKKLNRFISVGFIVKMKSQEKKETYKKNCLVEMIIEKGQVIKEELFANEEEENYLTKCVDKLLQIGFISKIQEGNVYILSPEVKQIIELINRNNSSLKFKHIKKELKNNKTVMTDFMIDNCIRILGFYELIIVEKIVQIIMLFWDMKIDRFRKNDCVLPLLEEEEENDKHLKSEVINTEVVIEMKMQKDEAESGNI